MNIWQILIVSSFSWTLGMVAGAVSGTSDFWGMILWSMTFIAMGVFIYTYLTEPGKDPILRHLSGRKKED